MERVSNYSYLSLIKKILGKRTHFTSDCEFFPNFDVIAKVISYKINGNEMLMNVITYPTKKSITIGTNMKNLKIEVLN